jgi:hypothetical protein
MTQDLAWVWTFFRQLQLLLLRLLFLRDLLRQLHRQLHRRACRRQVSHRLLRR